MRPDDRTAGGVVSLSLTAPFPWFGGKSRAASLVWERLGNVPNYVEPFFGSGAVLLGRPHEGKTETINDLDAFVANFWRSIAAAPEEVAAHADWPVNEADLHARHLRLVNMRDTLTARLMADPDAYDAKLAGWWCWGLCAWIGTGFCSGEGPWRADEDGLLSLSNAGRGIKRQLPQLSNAGQGINRQLPHLGDAGRGEAILAWFEQLGARLRATRIACGSWERVVTESVTTRHGLTGILLDPPYGNEDRADVYAHDSFDVAGQVRDWCIDNGKNPLLRIALCGYSGEGHEDLEIAGWRCETWTARGGYQNNGSQYRERIWFSPACNPSSEPSLFDAS